MVLLLYSLFSGDWTAPANHGRRADLRQLGFPDSPQMEEFPSVHEKVWDTSIMALSAVQMFSFLIMIHLHAFIVR